MAATFLESGGAATGGLEFFTGVQGTVSIDSSTVRANHAKSIKCAPPSPGSSAYVTASGGSLLTSLAGRLSLYVYVSQFNASDEEPIVGLQINTQFGFVLAMTTSGVLRIRTPSEGGTQIGSDGTVPLPLAQWMRVAVCWTITNATTFTIKVFTNGVLSLTANSGTLQVVFAAQMLLGATGGSLDTPRTVLYISDVYTDNDNSTNDPGNINVKPKLPAALNTNNFDTLGGSGANRYNRVSDQPLSETNYIAHLGATDVQENFGLEATSVGNANVSGVLVARSAWVWAKRGDVVTTAPKATGTGALNNSGTTVTATLSATVATGDIVVVAVADQMGGAAPTLTDSVGGNTWTALSGPTTNTIRASKWYSILTNGGASMVITATFGSANSSRAIAACAWSAGLFSASPLDKNVTNANDSTTPFNCPTTGTLAQANEIVLAFTYSAGNTSFTATAPALLGATVASSGGSATGNAAVAIGYQAVAATTAVVSVFAGTSRTSVQGAASLKYNTSGTRVAGTPKLMDSGSESAITLSGSSALYTLITDSASYPSNAAGIGMRSSGSGGADTYFYEGGTLISYIPAPIKPPYVVSQAVKRAATY